MAQWKTNRESWAVASRDGVESWRAGTGNMTRQRRGMTTPVQDVFDDAIPVLGIDDDPDIEQN